MRKILLAVVMSGLSFTQGCTSTPVSPDPQANASVVSSAPANANDELILQRATRLRLPY